MAYLYQRPGGRCEIRESHSTPRGPRSRTLVSFQGALTPELLDRAESAARRPLDREAIERRARQLGIAVRERRADAAARRTLALLRSGAALDPRLASLLSEALAELPREPIPERLADAAEWIGASDVERGRALRDVLRLYGAIAASPDAAPPPDGDRFPRFESRREAS